MYSGVHKFPTYVWIKTQMKAETILKSSPQFKLKSDWGATLQVWRRAMKQVDKGGTKIYIKQNSDSEYVHSSMADINKAKKKYMTTT